MGMPLSGRPIGLISEVGSLPAQPRTSYDSARSNLRRRASTETLLEEPDPYDAPSSSWSLSTDYHWEYGYDRAGFTYYARLYNDVPDDNLEQGEAERPIIWIGAMPCSVETVEQLKREMGFDLPRNEVKALRLERERHFGGQLGDSAEYVRDRYSLVREIELRHYLRSVQPFLGR